MPDEVTAGQTRISGDKPGGGEAAGHQCDWCSAGATCSFPITRKIKGGKPGAILSTGQYVYGCDEHEDVARRSTSVPRNAL